MSYYWYFTWLRAIHYGKVKERDWLITIFPDYFLYQFEPEQRHWYTKSESNIFQFKLSNFYSHQPILPSGRWHRLCKCEQSTEIGCSSIIRRSQNMCQTTYKMSAVLPNKNFSKPKYLLYFLCYKMFCPIRRCLIACRALQILQNVCILHFAHLYIRTHIVIIKRKKKHQKNREKSLTRPGPCRDVSLDSHPCPSHLLLDVSVPSAVTHHFTSPSLDNSVSPIIVPILLRQSDITWLTLLDLLLARHKIWTNSELKMARIGTSFHHESSNFYAVILRKVTTSSLNQRQITQNSDIAS